MFTSDKKYLSISINDNSLKVAQVKSSGAVEKVARVQAVSNSPEDLAKALKTALSGFDRKAPVVCVIPAANATSKSIEVPSNDPQEIKSIISLQATRHTPYSRDEIIISYANMGSTDKNNTRILLVIAHRNVVKERIDICAKAGLNPEKISFAAEGIGRFYAKTFGKHPPSSSIGIVDVSLTGITYTVLVKGFAVFSRYIPIGIKAIMEGADTQAKLIEEFNKSISGFVNEDIDTPPLKYLVTTDHEVVKNIIPSLAQSLNVDFQFAPFTNYIKSSTAIKKRLISEYGDDSFLDVIASGITASKSEVNLMPEEIVMKKQFERQTFELSKAGIAAVILMILCAAIILIKIYFKEEFLSKNLRDKFAPQREEVKKLQQIQNKNRLVREYLKERMVSLETLKGLYDVTPTEIYLSNISLSETGDISIEGVSDSMSRVFAYVKALEDSRLFKGVKTKSTATKKDKGKDAAVFEITMKLEEAKE